jgi:hypothetical protein
MTSTERVRAPRAAAPWHLWVAGVLVLALYAMGARDFVLTAAMDRGYFLAQGYGPAQIAYFTDYPLALRSIWALNLAAGLAAPALLLLRSRWAGPAALVSAAAQLCLLVLTFALRDRWAVLGPAMSLVDIAVVPITLGLWIYARVLRRRGVLR